MKKNPFFFWFFAALPVLLFLILIQLHGLRRAPPPVHGNVPAFTLTERSGKTVTEKDLAGKVWIADFIFTRCAGQCPMMTTKMHGLYRSLEKVHFVSFTADPDFDTPEVFKTYAEGIGVTDDPFDPAQGPRWLFLTGDKETLNRIAQGFHFSKIDEPMMHSLSFVLIDKKGRIRGYYDSSDPAALKKLHREAKLSLP